MKDPTDRRLDLTDLVRLKLKLPKELIERMAEEGRDASQVIQKALQLYFHKLLGLGGSPPDA